MTSSSLGQRFHDWVAGNPEDQVLRWIFGAALFVTVTVLISDLAAMTGFSSKVDAALTQPEDGTAPSPGIVPSILEPLIPGDRRVMPMLKPDGALAKPMTFDLQGNGKLLATGTITPGISEAFAAEVKKHGDYIKTVIVNSPGGSVADALVMGKLIRERKFSTEVEAGTYCASSCPLVFVGGVDRKAGARAIIGVHQVFSASLSDDIVSRDEMGEAQRISARCQRYLGDMGVDPQMWVNAMETPKQKLFVFTPDELKSLKIVTAVDESARSPGKQSSVR
jgi:hypothetical protein